jgi:hypothetical protein
MSEYDSDIPESQDAKPRKRKLDALAWIGIAVAVVPGGLVLTLMVMGVISTPLGLGIIFPIFGGIQILNATLRLKKPHLREVGKGYMVVNLKTLQGIGIMQVVLGVISLTIALAFGMIRGTRLW